MILQGVACIAEADIDTMDTRLNARHCHRRMG